MFLKISQNSLENTCVLFFNKVAGTTFTKKETLAQVFTSEFSEIFMNNSFTEHIQETASGKLKIDYLTDILMTEQH